MQVPFGNYQEQLARLQSHCQARRPLTAQDLSYFNPQYLQQWMSQNNPYMTQLLQQQLLQQNMLQSYVQQYSNPAALSGFNSNNYGSMGWAGQSNPPALIQQLQNNEAEIQRLQGQAAQPAAKKKGGGFFKSFLLPLGLATGALFGGKKLAESGFFKNTKVGQVISNVANKVGGFFKGLFGKKKAEVPNPETAIPSQSQAASKLPPGTVGIGPFGIPIVKPSANNASAATSSTPLATQTASTAATAAAPKMMAAHQATGAQNPNLIYPAATKAPYIAPAQPADATFVAQNLPKAAPAVPKEKLFEPPQSANASMGSPAYFKIYREQWKQNTVMMNEDYGEEKTRQLIAEYQKLSSKVPEGLSDNLTDNEWNTAVEAWRWSQAKTAVLK